jgi:hypothetical protein
MAVEISRFLRELKRTAGIASPKIPEQFVSNNFSFHFVKIKDLSSFIFP